MNAEKLVLSGRHKDLKGNYHVQEVQGKSHPQNIGALLKKIMFLDFDEIIIIILNYYIYI